MLLGLSAELISVHLLDKGTTIHSDEEREKMSVLKPAYIFVIDHGSRAGPPLVDDENTQSFVIDHHNATDADFPKGSDFVSACHSPPVGKQRDSMNPYMRH